MKQHLAAIRMLFDWLVLGQVLPMNPAAAVRGPKYVVRRGKTSVLTASQARQLLDSIDTNTIVGLRDRALIGVMVYSFARVGAVVGMRVEDFFQNGKRWWLRLHEKGGKRHEVPAHHKADAYLDEYLEAASIWNEKREPLFRSVDRKRQLTRESMHRVDVLRMIKRRALGLLYQNQLAATHLEPQASQHTWRMVGQSKMLRRLRAMNPLELQSYMIGRETPLHLMKSNE